MDNVQIERLALKKHVAMLSEEIERLRNTHAAEDHPDLQPLALAAADGSLAPNQIFLRPRRLLRGHFGKIYACDWAKSGTSLVSASQDGRLIIWNAKTANKLAAITPRSYWVMTVAFSTSSEFVGFGGLNNKINIHKVPSLDLTDLNEEKKKKKTPHCRDHVELFGHDAYISCVRFLDDNSCLSSSGDHSCIVWDIPHEKAKRRLRGHRGDVMSVALHQDSNVFVSGGCDTVCRLWDLRAKYPEIMSFHGHESDINAVDFLQGGSLQSFVSGSDDSTLRLYDIRGCEQMQLYEDIKAVSSVTSVASSKSGRYLFGGYDNGNTNVWDTATANRLQVLSGHESRVSCLSMHPDGLALASGSFDSTLKIWTV